MLGLMLLFFLGGISWLLSAMSTTSARLHRDRVTVAAMSEAKAALIGRAASDDKVPGSLPCPDTNNDGEAELLSGPNCPSYIGRLPWKTLDLPELRDGNGERLWYALSPELRDNPHPVTFIPVNAESTLSLTVNGTSDIAAIVFSPGTALESQNSRPSDTTTDYLDESNNDGDSSYVSVPETPVFNDKALAITRNDLFRVTNLRVLAEIRGPDDNTPGVPNHGLRHFYSVNGTFPWADTDNDGYADTGALSGSPPYKELYLDSATYDTTPGNLGWLNKNAWPNVITYELVNNNSVVLKIQSAKLAVIPCPNSPCP